MDACFVTMHILKCPTEPMFPTLIRSLLRTFLKVLIVNDVMARAANIFAQPSQALSFRTSRAEL
jgi:hypothetical protein